MKSKTIKPVRKAIFPVGGLGTRFLPATKAMPKEMLPVVDKPLIQYAVEEARAAGIEQFIFITGRGKEAIENHFDYGFELHNTLVQRGKTEIWNQIKSWLPAPGAITYTRQQEPLGLGHAVWCARDLIGDEPVAVLLSDMLMLSQTPCLQQLVQVYNQQGGNVVSVMSVPREQVNRYGIIDAANTQGHVMQVRGLVEKPNPADAPSTYALTGRYIIQPQLFEHLSHVQPGAGGEIQLTDALKMSLQDGAFHAVACEGQVFDCGDKIGFFEANIAYALARPDLANDVQEVLARYTNTPARQPARVVDAPRRRKS